MTEVLEKPVRPSGSECCGGGCCPCIWDHYYAALGRWEDQQEGLQQAGPAAALKPSESDAENADA